MEPTTKKEKKEQSSEIKAASRDDITASQL